METFSYVKHGYNPDEVNAYIQTLEQVIKSYKDKDNAIKNAIISAQVAADNIVKNAQLEAADIRNDMVNQLGQVYEAVHAQKEKLNEFQNEYNRMIGKYLHPVEPGDVSDVQGRLDAFEHFFLNLDTTDADDDLNA